MNKLGSTAISKFNLVLGATLLVVSGVACSHKSQKDNATPVPTSTPVAAATPAPTESKDAAAKPATATGTTSVTCTHGADTRELAVESKGSGCNTNYTKNGKTSSVATGTNGVDRCQKVVDKIRSKLEAGGYTCK